MYSRTFGGGEKKGKEKRKKKIRETDPNTNDEFREPRDLIRLNSNVHCILQAVCISKSDDCLQ